MKRLISATLALSLLGGTAAAAAPYDHGNSDYNGGYNNQGYARDNGNQDRGYDHRDRRSDNGANVAAGLGFLALVAILASQNNHRNHDGWYNRDRSHYRDGNGYNRGYDHGRDAGNSDRHR